MTNADIRSPESVLDFWLGSASSEGFASPEWTARWWKKDPAFDAEIREKFLATYDAIAAGKCEAWCDRPDTRVAYIIVLDQLARNMFRDTPKMYAEDGRALAATLAALDKNEDQELVGDRRVFLYMPLMHAEDLDAQNRCVSLFKAFSETCPPEVRERLESNHRYAIAHRDIVAKFGRFPHRNALVGRPSTPEEIEFLRQPGSSF